MNKWLNIMDNNRIYCDARNRIYGFYTVETLHGVRCRVWNASPMLGMPVDAQMEHNMDIDPAFVLVSIIDDENASIAA